MTSGGKEQLELGIPSSMSYLSLVNGVAEEIAGRLDVSGADRDAFTTSVIEACTNAIEHGNLQDPAKRVTLRFLFDSSMIEVFVTDEGDGFDPGDVRSPVKPENLLRERGRGVFILRAFMDEVHYSIEPSSGTTVHLIKYLGGNAQAAP